MKESGLEQIIESEDRNELKGDETPIVLDGKATEKFPSEPTLMERTKEVMENIGVKINGI